MNYRDSTDTSEKVTIENHTDIHQAQVDLTENNVRTSLEDASMSDLADQNSFLPSEALVRSDSFSGSEADAESGKTQVHRQHYEKFVKELESLSDSEAKLNYVIDFMEASLAQSGTPHFKSFWEARGIALHLFKENISPVLRSTLWAKYNELSKEARRLKEILDEQSAFAVEQIEIAVKALEDDIATFDEHLQKVSGSDVDISSQALSKRLTQYQRAQSELNLLNTQAARINALRKELIRTEMRIRQKNKFFQRLSAAGDKVFPRRKELIKEISQHFVEDVDAFIEQHFARSQSHDLFSLREEIKALQNAAKVLTLNTHSFTHTRMRLSECWDHIKGEEKERRKDRAQQKAVFKQNFDEAIQKIHAFNQAYQAQQFSLGEAHKQLEEITSFLRSLELGRDEVRILREELTAARKPLYDKQQADEQERHQQEQEREKQRRQKIQEMKQKMGELLKNNELLTAENLEDERAAITHLLDKLSLSKAEKQDLERQLKSLRDLISEKKESSLLTLSDNDRQSLLQLKEVLKQRKTRRQEIKDQIDLFRKAAGASGLDFEQALSYNSQISIEKERLEKINQGIKEVEQTIAQLEKHRKN